MAIGQDVTNQVFTGNDDYIRALLNGGWRWDTGGVTGDARIIRVYTDGSDYNGIQLANIESAIFLFENYANIDLQRAPNNTGNPASLAEIWIQLVNSSQIGGFGGYSGTTSEAEATGARTFDDVTIAEQGRVQTFLASDGWLISGQNTFPTPTGSLSPAGIQLLMHEFGHAMGLKHPHDGGALDSSFRFPGVVNVGDTGSFGLNQTIYTIMSYNNFQDQITPGGAFATMATPMAFDVAALQRIYGANTSYHNGNDFYVLPDPAFSDGAPGNSWSCIWDTGGIDSIVHNSAFDATIDLRPATLDNSATGGGMRSFTQYTTSLGTYLGRGFTIAGDFTNALPDQGLETGVIIENARGGTGNDLIIGNRADNQLDGAAGNDRLFGNEGGDTLLGRAGNDTISGGGGNDGIDSGAGNDTAHGGAGNDGMNKLDADGGRATFFGNEGNDTIDGAQERDILRGDEGDDLVTGSAGGDNISGGDGNDRLFGYWFAFDDVSDRGDIIWGDAGDDRIYGQTGNDTVIGGRGRDILRGGRDRDFFDFNAIGETPTGAGRDIILDFNRSEEDRIDLSSIDADTSANPGNDPFDFIGKQGFHGGGGEVRYAGGILQGDINGDRRVDFEIKVIDSVLGGGDLVL